MYRKVLFLMIAFMWLGEVSGFAAERFTLVIDAGHGGKDFGAPGAISNEKNLTLKYALAFGKLVEQKCPDVKVIYTRKTDVFIPLHRRAEIANKNKANLFLSFHINAVENNHTAKGFQSWTLGRGQNSGDKGIIENVNVAKRENSVIFLEKDYKRVYKGFNPNSAESDIMFEFIADKNREQSVELSKLMLEEVCRATGRQNSGAHQNNLAVLRLTSMPGALLELGFISTPEEEQFLNSDIGLERYTKGIYNAFIRYKNRYDESINVPFRQGKAENSGKMVPVKPIKQQEERKAETAQPPIDFNKKRKTSPPAQQEVLQTAQADESKPVFKIQIFISNRLLEKGDRHFKTLTGCEVYKENNYFKYLYGASNDYNQIYRLRKQISDKFPEAFIIAFKNGTKMDVNEAIKEFLSNKQ